MGFRVRRHLDRRRGQDRVSRRSKPVRGDRAIVVEVDDDDDDDDGIQVRYGNYGSSGPSSPTEGVAKKCSQAHRILINRHFESLPMICSSIEKG